MTQINIDSFLNELKGLENCNNTTFTESPSVLEFSNNNGKDNDENNAVKVNITACGPSFVPDLRVYDKSTVPSFPSFATTLNNENIFPVPDLLNEIREKYINTHTEFSSLPDTKNFGMYENECVWPRSINTSDLSWKELLIAKVSLPSSTIQLGVDKANHQLSMTDLQEVPVNNQITSTNSTSLLRAWNKNSSDFHRGDASSFPFRPGGIDIIESSNTTNSNNNNGDEEKVDWVSFWKVPSYLKTKAPGMSQGVQSFTTEKKQEQQMKSLEQKLESLYLEIEEEEAEEQEEQEKEVKELEEELEKEGEQEEDEEEEEKVEEVVKEKQEIDNIINISEKEFIEKVSSGDNTSSFGKSTSTSLDEQDQKKWAFHETKEIITPFSELITNPAIVYPFELDSFQKQAIVHMEKGDSVFISAHTSAGKTVIAEYAIAMAAKNMTRAIYTSPIKALSNQKFRDFKNTFGDVGLITGDVSVSPASSCLVLTTEILRSMLYKGADLIRDIEWVIFDEVHYLNDYERGVVWEEVIIMLPSHVKIILLSATVANPLEFADWIGRTKKMPIYVIGTTKRPVPLEHYIHTPSNDMFKLVDSNRRFIMEGYTAAYNSLYKIDTSDKNKGKGPARGGSAKQSQYSASSVGKTGWTKLINTLKEKNQLPVIVFSFSKNKCQEYTSSLGTTITLTNGGERGQIKVFIEESLARLRAEDKELPQILQIRDFLERGIGVHHGGLLPIVKELVEILFSKSLVKVLFATETFAMGVNMPAKTVVYSHIRKHDGNTFRDLMPGEYTQMSGRAGRRGLDTVGTVIITCWKDLPDSGTMMDMILGQPAKLNSQFRLTYNMILNLLRIQDFKVEDMIKRSFSEFSSQKEVPAIQKTIEAITKEYSDIPPVECILGEPDIENYFQVFNEAKTLGTQVQKTILHSKHDKYFKDGRVVVLSTNQSTSLKSYTLGVLVSCTNHIVKQYMSVTNNREFLIFALVNTGDGGNQVGYKLYDSNGDDIKKVCDEKLKIDVKAIQEGNQQQSNLLEQQLRRILEQYPLPLGPPGLDPIQKLKLKSLEFVDQYERLEKVEKLIPLSKCHNCPKLAEHYNLTEKKNELKLKLAQYKHTASDENLQLMPEFQIRLKILQTLGYIDQDNNVLVKGKVSREVNTCEELIIPELIFENAFLTLEPAEIVSVLSCLIFHEKDAIEPSLTPRLLDAQKNLIRINEKLCDIEIQHGLDVTHEEKALLLKFGLMEVVYEWARGMPFSDICKLTNVLEGTIVRAITRLGEACQEVRNCARIIGDTKLYQKMDEAIKLIKRDIVFASSLYVV